MTDGYKGYGPTPLIWSCTCGRLNVTSTTKSEMRMEWQRDIAGKIPITPVNDRLSESLMGGYDVDELKYELNRRDRTEKLARLQELRDQRTKIDDEINNLETQIRWKP